MSEPASPSAKRQRLKALIATQAVLTGGDFKLASGGQSSVFFDMKMTLLDPEGLNLVADLMLETLAGERFDALGGLVLGACPIVDAVVVKAWPARRITGFYVRKEPKARGTNKMIEGPLQPGAACVMVEDVTTQGSSVLKAVAEARAIGCSVATVVTCVDRQQGAR
ncbi:MAG: orotate phosphoribosyltransferase, partial [Rhodospirillaceae bacterium]|nr:orotate phosphoribosyltransferase [Rhodospirillaceae bacterium]